MTRRAVRRLAALATLSPVRPGPRRRRRHPARAPPRRRRGAASRGGRPPPPVVIVADPSSAEDVAVGEACRRGLGTLNGSVVAMDPKTGRVIAVVNPGQGVERAYQPCSVFKIVVGLAGLTEGVITPQSTYNCDGHCWLWPGHGPIDLRRALACPATRTSSGWARSSATRRCSTTPGCWAWARRPASTFRRRPRASCRSTSRPTASPSPRATRRASPPPRCSWAC